jgi:hypothetical protein
VEIFVQVTGKTMKLPHGFAFVLDAIHRLRNADTHGVAGRRPTEALSGSHELHRFGWIFFPLFRGESRQFPKFFKNALLIGE